MVKGYGDPVDVVGKEHVAVEGAPVELLFEILPEAALTGTSILKAIDRKFSLPYIVNIKIIVSMKKLSKFFRTLAVRLSAVATIDLTWSSG